MTTATATVLFCDVVSSTEHRARLGEVEADRFFREIEQLLRDEVQRTNGRVLKGAGDGIMAVFTAASDGAAAAVALHQRVHASAPELQLRVGVAAGDVSWEGDDCFGMPVVVAARLESACEPGGILVSAIARHLAGDRADAEYEPFGTLDLKGVPQPVDVFSISWAMTMVEELAWHFPTTLLREAEHPIVGREQEFRQMFAAWETAAAGDHGVVLLGGEAGAGKTRLATELARRCHSDGAIVVCGLCDSELSLAYQPWVMALDQLISQLPQSTLDDLRDDLAHLQALIPTIRRTVSGLTRPEALDPEAERHRMFGAVATVLEAASTLAPLVIIIDDVHWGGRQTLELFKFLVRAHTVDRCLLILTFRDTTDEVADALATTLADLRRLESVTRLTIGGIGSEAVFELLTGLDLDGDLRERAEIITERTQGNAFLVSELLLHASSDGVPDGVLDVVEGRLLRLGAGARELANLIAVAGRVELNVLLETTRSGAEDESDGLGSDLGELTRSGLVQELGGAIPAYQFAHALIRDAVNSNLPSFERSVLHQVLANAIETVHETDRRQVLTQLTRHFAGAAAVAGWQKAAYYGRRAAAQARRSAGYEEAIELIDAALEVTPAGTEERALLLIDTVDLLERCGRNPEAVTLAESAYDDAFEIGDLTLQARASIELERAAHLANASLESAVPHLRQVLERGDLLSPSLRSMVMGSLGRASWLSGRSDWEALTTDAVRIARELGDPDALSHALETACVVEHDPHIGLDLASELEAVTEAHGNIFRSMWAIVRQIGALITLGRLAEASAVLERLVHNSERYRFTNYRYLSLVFTHTLSLAAGDFEAAEAAAESADTDRPGDFAGVESSGAYGLQMFMIRRAQGRLEEMRPVLELVARQPGDIGMWRPGLMVAYAELGMVDEATAEFESLTAHGCAVLPRDTLWPLTLSFLADTCVLLDLTDAAPLLLAELEPFAGLTVGAGWTTNGGPADRCRARLAEIDGQQARADELGQSAADLARSSGSPVWQAQAATTLDWIQERRMASSTQHTDAGTEPEQAEFPDDLSAREVEVLAELALGHTNRIIAERLFISANTVANHVRAILRKTECRNRTEAAAYAFRHGLDAGSVETD